MTKSMAQRHWKEQLQECRIDRLQKDKLHLSFNVYDDHCKSRQGNNITTEGGTNYRTLWEPDGPAHEAVHDTNK
uniref:Uncharacterized protein n=1 Tax=Oryza meridionalis TaxID=40149 RepID=A0A0E0BZS0_9ORYZ